MSKVMFLKSQAKIMENSFQIRQFHHLSLKLLVMLFLAFPILGFSQNFKIQNTEDYFKSVQNTEVMKNKSANSIKSLIKDLHPSLYVDNGRVNSYGKNPIVLFVDANSVSKLKELKLEGNQIELVTIKINQKSDLVNLINLDVFQQFSSIKVIHFSLGFDCDVETLTKSVKIDISKYTLLYSIEKPS
ncbi:hypothetical protein B0I10_101343 [Flavobacterium lacus]|uniref:Uncharacterized protein n=2 Tax=Flavobacterium lacus TaxID=1353778 RepID=A0A328X3P0_9FLAO|nr:hypothetical protein B0I10_101343 [Flavobacterium lacus]